MRARVIVEIKVLIVDDTVFYRKIIGDILKSIPNITVVGTANNGEVALTRIRSLKPDLVTLDIEMPEMNGLEVLQKINDRNLGAECLMVSSKTQAGVEITVRALELGAFDFIEKPDESSPENSIKDLRHSLTLKLRSFSRSLEMKKMFKHSSALPDDRNRDRKKGVDTGKILSRVKRTEKSHVVAIGISTGGPKALTQLLPKLPASTCVPVFIVQHLPLAFSLSLAENLNAKSPLRVKVAVDGEEVKAGVVYLSPGEKQMKVGTAGGGTKIIRLTDDPPENHCKPSVDYLFRSIAREYGSRATCVTMTGMGKDGALGVRVARAAGSLSIAQDEESCVVYGMPKAVVDAGLADIIAPLDKLHMEIIRSIENDKNNL